MSTGRWSGIRKQRLSRRSVLRASARAGVGAAGLALVGCGDDDDDAQPQVVAEEQQQQQAMQQQAQQQAQADQQQQQAMQEEEQQQQAVAQQQEQQEQPAAQQQQEQQQVAAATDQPEPPRGGTLRFGLVSDFLPSYGFPYASEGAFGPTIWDTLTVYGDDGLTPEPHLAESWEFNDDQTMLTVHLRPGLTFHDGKPLTAEEVIKSLERMDDEDVRNNQVKSLYAKYVNSVEAIDETTLQFDLAWPGEAIFDVFQYANIHDADTIGGIEGWTEVNASGPYQFDSDAYEVGVQSSANRFENFYNPAALDRIEWNNFQDGDAMTLALRAGELDMAFGIPSGWYQNFVEDDDFEVKRTPPNATLYVMGMVGTGRGGGHPVLDDPKVRRALYRVIDRERIAAEVFENVSEPRNVVWPSYSPAYDASLDRDYFDLDEARQLISEAGYPDGTPALKIATLGAWPHALQMAQIIQQDAAQAGINVEPEAMDFGTWFESFLAAQHELYIITYSFFALHPQTLPVMNFQMRIPNSCAYDTPHYQAMIDGWATADSPAKRQALIDEFNRILDEEPWVAPICTYSEVWAAHTRVKGVSQNLVGNLRMRDVYFEDA